MNNSIIIMLVYLSFILVVTSLIPRSDSQGIRIFSLAGSLTYLLMCIDLYYFFNSNEKNYQFECSVPVIPEYNLYLTFGVDGINLCLVLLTAFITPLCLFAAKNITQNYKQFIIYLLLIELLLSLSFFTTNVLFFYVFFESVLIPMFLLIGVWGARERKIKAAYYFFIYTLVGSFFFLFGILYLYQVAGTFNYSELNAIALSKEDQKFLFWFFFYSFCCENTYDSSSSLITWSSCWSSDNWFCYSSKFIIKVRCLWFYTVYYSLISSRLYLFYLCDLCFSYNWYYLCFVFRN